MKSNPHKLSDILQKQKEELPATDNPRNLPYLLKKHKESDGNTIEKLHNNAKNKISDEEKNLNAISLNSNPNFEQMKSQPCQHNQDQMKTNMNPSITMTNMSNNQQNFNSIPPYFTVNNNTKNMINEPVMFKNYSNNLLNGNTPINQNNPVNLNQMNPFIAGNNNNLLMPQNLTMGQNSMNSLGNFVQIPVMIANRPSPQIQQIPQQFPMPMPMQGNWAVVDSFGNFNEQMGINNMAPNDAGILSNQNSNMQKIFDNNIFIQQGNHNNNNPMNNPNNQNVENNQNYQMNNIMSSYMSSFQEFETRMFDIIKNQNRTLQLIKDDNDKTHETLNKIKQELTQLKESVKCINVKEGPFENTKKNTENDIIEEITGDFLIKQIYNKTENNFRYELLLKTNFPKIIYKERYFKFDVVLADAKNKQIINNSNQIVLDLAIYTGENPPKMIRYNTAGNKMVNWNQEKLLFEGEMLFEKVQIREVSSHYRNGHIFLIIFAKGNQNNTFQKKEGNEQTLNINYQEIKPLVIERLIVRAKKLKQLKLKKKVRAKKKENLSETSI